MLQWGRSSKAPENSDCCGSDEQKYYIASMGPELKSSGKPVMVVVGFRVLKMLQWGRSSKAPENKPIQHKLSNLKCHCFNGAGAQKLRKTKTISGSMWPMVRFNGAGAQKLRKTAEPEVTRTVGPELQWGRSSKAPENRYEEIDENFTSIDASMGPELKSSGKRHRSRFKSWVF